MISLSLSILILSTILCLLFIFSLDISRCCFVSLGNLFRIEELPSAIHSCIAFTYSSFIETTFIHSNCFPQVYTTVLLAFLRRRSLWRRCTEVRICLSNKLCLWMCLIRVFLKILSLVNVIKLKLTVRKIFSYKSKGVPVEFLISSKYSTWLPLIGIKWLSLSLLSNLRGLWLFFLIDAPKIG